MSEAAFDSIQDPVSSEIQRRKRRQPPVLGQVDPVQGSIQRYDSGAAKYKTPGQALPAPPATPAPLSTAQLPDAISGILGRQIQTPDLRSDPVTQSLLSEFGHTAEKQKTQLLSDMSNLGILRHSLKPADLLGEFQSNIARGESSILADRQQSLEQQQQTAIQQAIQQSSDYENRRLQQGMALGNIGGTQTEAARQFDEAQRLSREQVYGTSGGAISLQSLGFNPDTIAQSFPSMFEASDAIQKQFQRQFGRAPSSEEITSLLSGRQINIAGQQTLAAQNQAQQYGLQQQQYGLQRAGLYGTSGGQITLQDLGFNPATLAQSFPDMFQAIDSITARFKEQFGRAPTNIEITSLLQGQPIKIAGQQTLASQQFAQQVEVQKEQLGLQQQQLGLQRAEVFGGTGGTVSLEDLGFNPATISSSFPNMFSAMDSVSKEFSTRFGRAPTDQEFTQLLQGQQVTLQGQQTLAAKSQADQTALAQAGLTGYMPSGQQTLAGKMTTQDVASAIQQRQIESGTYKREGQLLEQQIANMVTGRQYTTAQVEDMRAAAERADIALGYQGQLTAQQIADSIMGRQYTSTQISDMKAAEKRANKQLGLQEQLTAQEISDSVMNRQYTSTQIKEIKAASERANTQLGLQEQLAAQDIANSITGRQLTTAQVEDMRAAATRANTALGYQKQLTEQEIANAITGRQVQTAQVEDMRAAATRANTALGYQGQLTEQEIANAITGRQTQTAQVEDMRAAATRANTALGYQGQLTEQEIANSITGRQTQTAQVEDMRAAAIRANTALGYQGQLTAQQVADSITNRQLQTAQIEDMRTARTQAATALGYQGQLTEQEIANAVTGRQVQSAQVNDMKAAAIRANTALGYQGQLTEQEIANSIAGRQYTSAQIAEMRAASTRAATALGYQGQLTEQQISDSVTGRQVAGVNTKIARDIDAREAQLFKERVPESTQYQTTVQQGARDRLALLLSMQQAGYTIPAATIQSAINEAMGAGASGAGASGAVGLSPDQLIQGAPDMIRAGYAGGTVRWNAQRGVFIDLSGNEVYRPPKR